jgi:hypothetical protein
MASQTIKGEDFHKSLSDSVKHSQYNGDAKTLDGNDMAETSKPPIVKYWPVLVASVALIAQYVGMSGKLETMQQSMVKMEAKIDILTAALHNHDKELAVIRDRETRPGK